MSLPTVRRRASLPLAIVLAAPATLFMLTFFALPLAKLLKISLFEFRAGVLIDGVTLNNYAKLLLDPFYLRIVLRTLGIAVMTTIITVALGYPVAVSIVRASPRWRSVLLLLVLTPMLVGGVVRCYGWLLILDESGLINSFARSMGIIQRPEPMLFGFWSVTITMVEILIPFFVLPLLGVLTTLDPLIERAAYSLGASRVVVLTQITLPLLLPGLLAGASIIFSLALTIFVVPQVIGGPSYQLLSTMAYQQTTQVGNVPFGAAISVLMLVLSLLALALLGQAGRGRRSRAQRGQAR